MSVYQDKKRKTFYVSVPYVNWQGEHKQKVMRGFKTKKEAKEAERQFLESYSQQPNMSFSVLYDEYMHDCRIRLKLKTIRTKEHIYRASILPFFGDMNICDITPAHVRKWENEIIQRCALTTQKVYYEQLNAIFNFAVKYKGLRLNPAVLAGTMGATKADQHNFWTREEFQQVIERIDDLQTRAAYTLLFYSGMRMGELLGLNIGDYDREQHTISVNKNLARIEGRDIIDTPKTRYSVRVISIPSLVCKLLDAHIEMLYNPKPSDRLFLTMSEWKLRQRLYKAAAKADVKRLKVHELRHSHASLLMNMECLPKAISERLGHSDIKITLDI